MSYKSPITKCNRNLLYRTGTVTQRWSAQRPWVQSLSNYSNVCTRTYSSIHYLVMSSLTFSLKNRHHWAFVCLLPLSCPRMETSGMFYFSLSSLCSRATCSHSSIHPSKGSYSRYINTTEGFILPVLPLNQLLNYSRKISYQDVAK